MDKRKGLISGYKRFGPTGRFLFWIAVIGLVAAIVFFIIQQETGATKEGQIAAQLDSDLKHKEEMGQFHDINSKIDTKSRPYIGVEKMIMIRDNDLLFPQNYLTLYLKNFGELPANDVEIYIDILDEVDIREKNKKFPFRHIVPGNFLIMPKDTLKIDKKLLNSGVILDVEEYDKLSEERTIREINRREQFFKDHNRFPRQDIIYVKLEIKYRGIEKVNDPPFYLKAFYSPEIRDKEIVWVSNNSEVK